MEFLERRLQRESTMTYLITRNAWVADRPQERRFHSEPRGRNAESFSSHNTNWTSSNNNNSLPPAGRITSYVSTQNGYLARGRDRSVPSMKTGSTGRVRKINSAPKEDVPTVTVVLAKSRGQDSEIEPAMRQRTFGQPTRASEEKYIRSTKFATSWAEARAEMQKLRSGSPGDMPPHGSPDRSSNANQSSYPPTTTSYEQKHQHKPTYYNSYNRPHRREQKRVKVGAKSHPSDTPGVSNDKTNTQDMLTDSDGKSDADDEGEEETQESKAKPGVKKRPWDDSVNVTKDSKVPPKLSTKKYEEQLTFKPTITSSKEVYKRYTGKDGFDTKEDTMRPSDVEEEYTSPAYESDASRSADSSPTRENRERILNKREAEMYIKMTNVYGSDAFKNQRKEWFLERLNKVQEQKSKFESELKQLERKKREEKRARQQRQLKYVRDRFRNEQIKRFRTQYVTSRVLQHEHADRAAYGLPEDYDDPDRIVEETPKEKDEADQKQNGEKDIEKKTVKGGKDDSKGKPGGARSGARSRENASRERTTYTSEDEAKMHQMADKQKSWYANKEHPYLEKDKLKGPYYPAPGYDGKPYDWAKNRDKEKPKTPPKPEKEIVIPWNFRKKEEERYSMWPDVFNKIDKVEKKDEDEKKEKDKDLKSAKATDRGRKGEKTYGRSKTQIKDTTDKSTSGKSDKTGGVKKTDEKQYTQKKPVVANGHADQSKSGQELKQLISNKGPTSSKTEPRGSKADSDSKAANGQRRYSEDVEIPVVFTGHFRQEQDKNYHKIDSTLPEEAPNKTINTAPKSVSGESSSKIPTVLTTNDRSKTNLNTRGSSKKDAQANSETKDIHRNNDKDRYHPPSIEEVISNKGTIQKSEPVSKKTGASKPEQQTNQSDTKQSNVKDSETSQTKPANVRRSETRKTSPSKATHERKPSPSNTAVQSSSPNLSHSVAPARRPTVTSTGANKDPHRGRSDSKSTVQTHTTKDRVSPARRPSHGKAALTAQIFNVNTGPSWDPKTKVPKMEGIDTVVVQGKDGRGRVVKRRKHVKDVVKEADAVIKKTDASIQAGYDRISHGRLASPDVTLGSDFEVDDEDENETEDDIFERLRKKYNIKIDSDDESRSFR